jgi:AraC-like DNA-binding protein
MIFARHVPAPPLAQYVEWFWFYEGFFPGHTREHVLPDGSFELVINLREETRKLFDRRDAARFESFRRGWISGTHSQYIVIDAVPDSSMMGAHFKPGGAAPFLGAPADDFSGQVVDLEAIWGLEAWGLRDRLLAAAGQRLKFRALEQFLMQRLAGRGAATASSPRVRWALERFVREPQVPAIGAIAGELGVSHKHFIHEFRRQVGLTPRMFCRIRRFQEVLAHIQADERVNWVDLAYSCGYYDQAHFIRDFQAFAGLNPSAYVGHALEDHNFVPIAG